MISSETDQSGAACKKAGLLPWALALIAPVVPVLMLVRSWESYLPEVSDFPEYYAASWLSLHGRGGDLYVLESLGALQHQLFPELARAVVPFLLTPPAVIFIAPLSLLPASLSWVVWLLLIGVALLVSLAVLARLLRLSAGAILYTFAVMSVSGAVFECLKLGQIAPLLLLAYSAGLWFESRAKPVLAGLSYAILLVKPQFLLPVLVACGARKRYRCLSVLGLACALIGSVSLLFVGAGGWKRYLELSGAALASPELVATGINSTLRGQLLRLLGPANLFVEPVFWTVWAVSILALYRGLKTGRPGHATLMAMPVAFLIAPYAQSYDLVLLLPSILCFVKSGLHRRLSAWIMMPYIVACTVLLLPFHSFFHYGYLLRGGVINAGFWLVASYLLLVVVAQAREKPLDAEDQTTPVP
ncbi:MAG: glycosyltransferase family 87 protein [Candidatus Obscuribacterales bacterium]